MDEIEIRCPECGAVCVIDKTTRYAISNAVYFYPECEVHGEIEVEFDMTGVMG